MADRVGVYSGLTAEERGALIRRDFATFVQVMYAEVNSGAALIWHPYLDLISSRLSDVAHGARKNLIITMPPRHLKSFCVSVALPAFVLGHYPSQQVMCVSYGQDLAREFAGGTLQVMTSRPYIEGFGPRISSARPKLITLRTLQGGVRRATSIDGVATGVGGDLLIFDDPQKPGETLSDAIRRSTNQAYERTFLSRRNLPANARIIIVMQRLHQDDFVGHVLELGGDWAVVNLPAIAEENLEIPFYTFMGPQIYRRHIGEALHPGRISLEELALIRKASGEAVWASQYQQRPAPEGGGLVKEKWFKRYTAADVPEIFDRIVQSWDTANKVQEWNDYSVCTTWGVKGKHVYLLHVFRGRMIFPDLRKAAVQQAQLHEATTVLIEDKASGTQLIQELRAANFGRAQAVKPTTDKETRMVNQTALIENGFVHIPAEAPWLDDFMDEVVMFPNSKHDDQIDSMSQALEAINSWGAGSGLYELYRQDAEALKAQEEEIWVIEAPPGMGAVFDIEGAQHLPGQDGYFHLKRSAAVPLINKIGWRKVG